MQIYCSKRKKHTYNACPKTLVLISKNKIKGKSKCAIFLTEKTFIHKGLLFKLKTNMVQKVNQKFIFSFLLTDVIKEQEDLLRKVQKKY